MLKGFFFFQIVVSFFCVRWFISILSLLKEQTNDYNFRGWRHRHCCHTTWAHFMKCFLLFLCVCLFLTFQVKRVQSILVIFVCHRLHSSAHSTSCRNTLTTEIILMLYVNSMLHIIFILKYYYHGAFVIWWLRTSLEPSF